MSESIPYAGTEGGPPNRMAMAAMILGITGLVLSIVAIGGLLGAIAVVLGIMGVIKPGRKGMSIAGITTGAIAMMIGLVATLFWAGFIYGMATGASRRATARDAATRAEITNLKMAVETFEVDCGRYPSTPEALQALVVCPKGLETTWHGKYIERVPEDRWGHAYEYRGPDVSGGDFEIRSAGPDGVFNTADDLSSDTP